MRDEALPFLVSASLMTAGAATPCVAQEPPVFGVDAQLVRIDAVVLDEDGQPVTGLTAADFEVRENGEEQRIVSFEAIVVDGPGEPTAEAGVATPRPFQREAGRYLILFLDDHHLSQETLEQMRGAIGRFVTEVLRDSDWVTVIAPQNGVNWTSRSAVEHRLLPAVMERMKVFSQHPFGRSIGLSVTSTQSRSPSEPATSHLQSRVEAAEAARLDMEGTLDGVLDTLRRLSDVPGRKSLLLYSHDLVDRNHPDGPGATRFDPVIDLARRSNVVIEYVDARGLTPGTRVGVDHSLARETGGRTTVSNDGARILETVLRESSAYYLIGYEPPEGRRRAREVEVRVRRTDLEVRARSRYFAGAIPEEEEEAALPPGTRALRSLSDAAGIGFEVRTAFEGMVATRVVLAIRPPAEPRERRLRLLAEVVSLAGSPPVHDAAELGVPPTPGTVRVTREWALSPGVWQARIVLEDVDTGEVGSLLHTFAVPER